MQLLTILFLTCYGSTNVLCESPPEIIPPPFWPEISRPLPVECEDFDTKLADDGCNSCICMNGVWRCPKKACPQKRPVECEDADKKLADDGCNTCYCMNGVWGCTEMACDIKLLVECEDGDEKLSDDGCNTCNCVNGVWGCTNMACDKKLPESESLELPDCKSSGGKCMRKRNELKCKGIINMDYECPCGRSCCLRAHVLPPPLLSAYPPTQCPQDCATVTIRDPITGCESCRCDPNFTHPLVLPPPLLSACPPTQCHCDGAPTVTISDPITGCKSCRCDPNFTHHETICFPPTRCPVCSANFKTEIVRDPNTGCQICQCRPSGYKYYPGKIWRSGVCGYLTKLSNVTLDSCFTACTSNSSCTAFYFSPPSTSGLLSCKLFQCPLPVPEPTWDHDSLSSYAVITGDSNICPLIMECPIDCPTEFYKMSNGCKACRCKPLTPPHLCPRIPCPMDCATEIYRDNNGCIGCRCK